MKNSTDFRQSFWWSSLSEFGEEVLVANRKKYRVSQQAAALRLGLHQSEVSRIERGLTRPKSIVLTTEICDLYRLSSSQRKKYLELTSGLSKIEPNLMSSLLDNQINTIARLNRSGFPAQAIQQFRNLRIWIESNFDLKSENYSFLTTKMTHLLLEESAAWWDIELPSKVYTHTTTLINKMELLALLNKNNSSQVNTYIKINKGFHAYIDNRYHDAIVYFNDTLPLTTQIDSLWNLEVFRATLVALGKTKSYSRLQNIEKQAFKYINNPSKDYTSRGYLLEGLARAYAEFNIKKSLIFFDLASRYIKEAKKEPDFLSIRSIQLTRSLLNIFKLQNKNRNCLLRLAEPALKDANRFGFTRHEEQILSVINN